MGYRWADCRSHDKYPVVGLVFAEGAEKFNNVLLFDSGADANYVAVDVVARESIDDADAIVTSVPYNGYDLVSYELADVPVLIGDGEATRSGPTNVTVVMNWIASAFTGGCAKPGCNADDNPTNTCTYRSGVISTKILDDLGVAIVLDGRTQQSYLS